jgi:deoxycytidine triphosphate deaminase
MAVALYPLQLLICSFTFHILSSPAEIPYGRKKANKYMDQQGPEGSRLWLDLEGGPDGPKGH